MESFVSLGRLHIPIFGLFAAAGLMAALALGLRTAVLARIDRDAFWDLGFVAVIGAFVISRVVLVLENIPTFVHYPLAVLELPLLTSAGLAGTALLAGWYAWKRKLPVFGVLDATAPCAALLLAFQSLGLWADGTRFGMPTTVPWGVGSSFGRVHPVELYATVAWAVICLGLMLILREERTRGETAASGLVLGGLAYALLAFFRLPNVLYGTQTLDSEQWHGVEMIVAGGLLLAWLYGVSERARNRTAEEVSRAV